jgi:threonine aldolase
MPGVTVDVETVQTNIVVFRPPAGHDAAETVERLAAHGLRVSNYGARGLRVVTHYEIDDEAVEWALAVLRDVMVRQREPVVA